MGYGLDNEERNKVANMAFGIGFDFGIRHYKREENYDDVITRYSDRKEEFDDLYEEFFRIGVHSKMTFQ